MLQMALMAAPLVLQGISGIASIFKGRKAKKAMKAQLEQLTAQNAQGAKNLQMMAAKTFGTMNTSYMGPSGIQAGQNGVGTMSPGQLPPSFG